MTEGWPADPASLADCQRRLAALTPTAWTPPADALRVAAGFVAFLRGEQGPGQPGDRAWVGAVLVVDGRVLRRRATTGLAAASYSPGLLALREGPMLEAALAPLARDADVLLVDATGRDHPRRAGLALHLGARLSLPSVGVTHRPLLARGSEPDDAASSTSPLVLDGEEVGRWVRTAAGVRPVAAHAAWRTDPRVAAEVVQRCCTGRRTPEPLREARRVARERRSATERLHDRGGVLGHP